MTEAVRSLPFTARASRHQEGERNITPAAATSLAQPKSLRIAGQPERMQQKGYFVACDVGSSASLSWGRCKRGAQKPCNHVPRMCLN
jgi:hypothetical protein